MRRDDLINLVLMRSGRRHEDEYLQSAARLEIALIQTRLEEGVQVPAAQGAGIFYPWFLLNGELTPFACEPFTRRLALPEDFIALPEDGGMQLQTVEGHWKHLPRGDYDVLFKRYPERGTPQYFAWAGNSMYLFPEPDVAYDLRFMYYARQPALSANIENAWTTHCPGLLMAELGLVLAERYLMNQEQAAAFIREIDLERAKLHARNTEQEMAGRNLIMGE